MIDTKKLYDILYLRIKTEYKVVCFEGGHGYAFKSFARCAEAVNDKCSAKAQTATFPPKIFGGISPLHVAEK